MEHSPERALELGTDFELPYHDAVTAGNWEQRRDEGFRWYGNDTRGETARFIATVFQQNNYGAENVLTGDPYRYNSGKPIESREGKFGIYVRIPDQELRDALCPDGATFMRPPEA